MNRESLFSRFAAPRSPLSKSSTQGRRETRLVGLEPLEERKMLIATVYVNDNWVLLADNGDPGLNVDDGDIVTNTADVNDPGSITAEYGFDAFGIVGGQSVATYATIGSAMPNVSENGTLSILGGTYKESDIVVTAPMKITGATGTQKSLIVPEVVSNHGDLTNFGVNTHSGFIVYSQSVTLENLLIDGNGNNALGGTMHYHHGITTLYDTQNGGNYASVRNGNLAPNNMVPANSDTNIRISNVTVSNTWWHGITLSGVSGQNIANNRILNVTVNNVGQAGLRDLDRIGILVQNHDQGEVLNSSVSNAGVGIASGVFGTASFGSNTNARNKSGMRLNTVTDVEQRAYSVSFADGAIDLNFILDPGAIFSGFDANKAVFTSTSNNAVGLYINYSDPVVLGFESTNAKIGVKIENTTTTDLRLPIFSGITLTGPGTAVAGSYGILADNSGDLLNPVSFGIASTVKVTNYQTGLRSNQVNALAEKNTLLIDRPSLSGNGTAISVGNNALLQGNSNTTDAIVTSGTATIQPGFPESFFVRDSPTTFAGPFADVFKTGSATLNSTATFDARITGKTGTSTTVFSFDEEVGDLPFGLIPPVPDNGGTYDPYGSSFEPGQVSQTGGQFRIEDGALNGPLVVAYTTLNHPDPNEPGRFILDPVDISQYSTINIVAKLGNANQAKAFIFGLSDTDGDLALFTVSTEGFNSTSYSTVSINLAAPGIPTSLGDTGAFELSKVMGFAILGDEGLLNGATNVPFNILFDEISASSLVENSSLNVTGSVNLGSSNLNVTLNDGYTPTLNQTFTIINNDAADAVVGTFAGAPQNATISSGGHKYQVSYTGGTGNDVILTYKGTVGANSTVAGRHIFYNQSVWDGNSAAISAVNDNAAIAPGKVPHLPGGGVAVAANITSFTRGINGIMVDLSTGVNHTGITAADFIFKVGNNNAPNTWAAAPAPSAISVIPGGGVGGSDRVEITWAQNAIKNQWLEVQVLATANTGLAAADVHFWGNRAGDSATTSGVNTFETTSTDASQVFLNIGGGKPITDLRDYNRDGSVNSTDASLVFSNIGNIQRISIAGGGPFAPEADPAVAGDDGGSAVASALATKSGPSGLPKLPGWIASRLSSVDLNSGPIAKLFTHLAEANTPRANAVLAKVNQITDALDLDDSLLESLIEGRA